MRHVTQSREDFIPEYLRLPDGRAFLTIDLMKVAKKNYKSHKIKNTAQYFYQPESEVKPNKKELYERLVNSKIHEVAREEEIDETKAWYRIKYAHKVLNMAVPNKANFK
jgi:hypothetical protein